jgi:alpha-L-fucosidase
MSLKLIALFLAALCLLTPFAGAQEAQTPSKDDRMQWWRDARFGMFIHWGVYAVPAGRWKGEVGGGEWIMEHRKIPISEYEPLAEQFTAENYDPAEWAKLAREAGMKYVVITSKHHDGFALWDSKLSDWDVMRTPHKQDLLAPLAEAVREEGLHFGLYHSIMDWHHPDYQPRRAYNDLAEGEPDFDRFREYLHGQVEEIITNYQPEVLWFDGEWEDTWNYEYGKALQDHVRSLKPDIIINNRVGKSRQGMAGLDDPAEEKLGDFGTPEQQIPATGLPGVDWESCMTMNGTWGYMVDDVNWKPTRTLIRNLIECASKGGNYLLNVGPTADGRIPDESAQRLREIGKWMGVNGESIYGTTAGPFSRLPWGRATRKGNTLYLHVYEWPQDGKLAVPVRNTPARAWLLLDEANPLTIIDGGEHGAVIMLPETMPDEDATVIALEIEGEPDVLPVPSATQGNDGTIELDAADADLGAGLGIEQIEGKPSIGFWTNAEAEVAWDVKVSKPGRFAVTLEFACDADSGGSRIVLAAGEGPSAARLEWEVPPTGGWRRFETAELGEVEIEKAGVIPVRIEPLAKPGLGVMNLRRVVLTPVQP